MSTKIGFIGIVTSNMAASLAFYSQFDLSIPEGADTAPHVDLELGGGLQLALDTVEVVKMSDPEFEIPTGPSRTVIAFRVDTPAAVDAKFAEIESAGHAVVAAPFDAFWGQRYASVADHDGNQVDIFCPLSSMP